MLLTPLIDFTSSMFLTSLMFLTSSMLLTFQNRFQRLFFFLYIKRVLGTFPSLIAKASLNCLSLCLWCSLIRSRSSSFASSSSISDSNNSTDSSLIRFFSCQLFMAFKAISSLIGVIFFTFREISYFHLAVNCIEKPARSPPGCFSPL